MIDQTKNTSKVKKGLMVLNRLKANSNSQDPQKIINSNLSSTHHQPDMELDLKKLQCQLLSTEDFMLSNAEFNVKNLLTGFLEAVEEEDKSKIIESKIKTIKESQFEFEQNKVIDVIEEEKWGKAKTKIQSHYAQKTNKNTSSKNINMHFSSNALGGKYVRNPYQNKLEIMNNKKNTTDKYFKLKENNASSYISSNCKLKDVIATGNSNYNVNDNNNGSSNKTSKIQFLTNQVYDISSRIKSNNSQQKRRLNKIKSSNNLGKVVQPTTLEKNQAIDYNRRFSIPSDSQNNIVTYVENSLKHCKNKKSILHKQSFVKEKQMNHTEANEEGYSRSQTYTINQSKPKDKDIENNANNKNNNLSYRRFKSKEDSVPSFGKYDNIKEIDILNLKGLSQLNKRKLSQICNKLKQNIVNDEQTNLHCPTKDINIKVSTEAEDIFLFKNAPTVTTDEKHRNLSRKGYVYDSLDDEEIEDEVEGKLYINTSSLGFWIYETIICITIGHVVLYQPYSLAHDFNIGRDSSLTKKIINFSLDGLYLFDLCLRFFVPYQNFDEVLVTNNEFIALHYLSTTFICDFTAAIPVNSILFWFSASSFYYNNFPNYYNTNTKKIVDLFFILPIVKIFKLYKWNKFSLSFQNFVLEFTHFIRWSKVYLSLILLLLSIHLLSCIFIFLGQLEYPNWIVDQKLDTSPFGTIYVASVYYILSSVFTIGYGDITSISRPERLFNLFLLVVGIMVYSWALSSISTYIQTSDAKTLEFKNKCKLLEEIRITHEKMPYELFDKIQRFLRYRVKNEKKDKTAIFDSLPIILRNNLIHEMYKPIIENFIFFKNFNNTDFIVRVILAFKPILGLKNDILVKEGDYIEEIIFVKRGNLALEIPLPIIVNPETLKKNRISLTHTFSKSLNGVYTFNTNIGNNTAGKNLYSLEDPKSVIERENLKGTRTIGLDNYLRTTTKPSKTKEPLSTRTYVKILEIRKNEHFGDILMFLNRRSPLSVKVKSKYAEMFFLKKTDAIEISMNYPKIWRSINKKSLFNMEQIDRLINKALKLFFISNEGQKNLTHTKTSQFFETLIAKSYTNEMKNKDYPRTQSEIVQLLSNKNEKCELQSIPSDLGSIIIEESQDYERSSLKETSSPKKHRDDELITESNSIKDKYLIKENQLKDEDSNDSETHSTLKMNIDNKSILLTERTERNGINDKLSNKKTQELTTTPFRYSDINTEIYPNEELINFESYVSSINVNDRFPPSNSQNAINSVNSLNHVYNLTQTHNNVIFRDRNNNDSEKSNDEKSEVPFVNRNSYVRKNKREEDSNYNCQFKTIKIHSPQLSHKQSRLENTIEESIIKLNPIKGDNNSNFQKVSSINYASCGNFSFTINSEYNNINQMNNNNISATHNLLSAIFSMNISEIEKALKKCSFCSARKLMHRTSLSLTSISIKKPKSNHRDTSIQMTSLNKPDLFIIQNEELKTISDRLHKRKFTKAKSINIASPQQNSLCFRRDSQFDALYPIEQKKLQISKFNQTKENYLKKAPTFSNLIDQKRNNVNINQPATINLGGGHSDNSPEKNLMSPRKRLMSPFKHTKTLNTSKPNLLNVISENIVKNSQNLNNPELFYLQYFQEIMNEKNDLKEQENLVRRLEDTEKFLFDSVRRQDKDSNENNNIIIINGNNNT